MKKILIKNSNIYGNVKIDGSKNSALPIICASLLTDKKTTLYNIPNIIDVNNLITISNKVGANIKRKGNKLIIKPRLEKTDLLDPMCKTFRASYYLMGVYLALFKHATIYLPGGCSIGKRPIDYHLLGFEKLGADYEIIDDYIDIKIINPKPANIVLPKQSLGAAINIALVASKINGTTTIQNISKEPEMIDFINFMNIMGNDLKIDGTTLYINGSYKDLNNKNNYQIIPDRIEAATYLALGLITDSVKIKYKGTLYLDNFLTPLINNGAIFKRDKQSITACKSTIQGFSITSGNYPLLSTDIFPLLLPIFAYSKGTSTLIETIYEDRFKVCEELQKIGVNIIIEKNKCTISDIKLNYKLNVVKAHDLRCAASLLIYSIAKKEDIIIENIDIIERGYSNIYNKLKKIGLVYEFIN
ncbi:MAG: UDP-N-acetylglucosamine 1-carboxyvinyltransferase [Erysipelotrichaceae bacterium]